MKQMKQTWIGGLGKIGVTLALVLPTLVAAESYYGGGNALNQSVQGANGLDPNYLNNVRLIEGAQETARSYNQHNETNNKLIGAIQRSEGRAREVIKQDEKDLEGLSAGAKRGSTAGLEQAGMGMTSAFSNLYGDCNEGVDSSIFTQITQAMKSTYNNIVGGLNKQVGDRTDDIAAKGARATAQARAAYEKATGQYSEQQGAWQKSVDKILASLKDPRKFVEIMKAMDAKQLANIGQNAALLSQVLLNPDGLTTLLAAAAKDRQLVQDVGLQLANLASGTLLQMPQAGEDNVNALQTSCSDAQTAWETKLASVGPINQQNGFSQTKADSISRMKADAAKANCNRKIDFAAAKAAGLSAMQNIQTAAASGDANQLFQTFTDGLMQMGAVMAPLRKDVLALGKACRKHAKLAEFYAKDEGLKRTQQENSGQSTGGSAIAGGPQGTPAAGVSQNSPRPLVTT